MAQTQYRTVIDKELGSVYQNPNGVALTDYGYFDGSPQELDPAAYRVFLALFLMLDPAEDNRARGFPYTALRNYDSQQTSEGQTPIFVTATYNGKKRPVLFSWSLALQNNKPTADQSQWEYAVNVQDSRYIHFWINQFAQPLLAKYQVTSNFGPNIVFHIDQACWIYSLYGVLDDNNNFVAGVPWDSPYPQNQSQFESAIETFFSQLKALAPNIVTVVNIGTQATPSHYPQLFANIGGAMTENLYDWVTGSAYSRNAWYNNNFQYYPWLASQNRITTLRSEAPSSDPNSLLDSFVLYSLLKGMNSFFAIGDTNANTINPSEWEPWAAQLSSPISAMQAGQPSSQGTGFRLFSRNFKGGTVYLNGTGSTVTVQLNSKFTYYDPNGNPIPSHSIQIPDARGTFVTTYAKALLPPQISPRYGATVQGPVSVTIQSQTNGATIHYTLDGSTPASSSPVYSGPIAVSKSMVVSARAFYGGQSSYPATASYTVSTSSPTVQLQVTSDSGMSGSYYPVVTLSAIPNGKAEVFYTVVNGTPTSGSYTLPPGMTSGILPITTGSSGVTTVTLTNASGATLGKNQTLQYTILK